MVYFELKLLLTITFAVKILSIQMQNVESINNNTETVSIITDNIHDT